MIFSLMHFAYMMHPFIGLSLYLNTEIVLSFQDRGKDLKREYNFWPCAKKTGRALS